MKNNMLNNECFYSAVDNKTWQIYDYIDKKTCQERRIFMNKEEVLARSRKERINEGVVEAENRGRKWGYVVFSIVGIFIIIFNFINGQKSYEIMALVFALLEAEAYTKYLFTKQKVFFISSICGAIATVAFLASHILLVMG